MVFLPYVTPTRVPRADRIVRADWRQALVASAWFLAATAVRGQPRLARRAAGRGRRHRDRGRRAALTGWRYCRRVGGITGDFLGATEQLGEDGRACRSRLAEVNRTRAEMAARGAPVFGVAQLGIVRLGAVEADRYHCVPVPTVVPVPATRALVPVRRIAPARASTRCR